MKNNQGFTIVELVIVIAVVAILAAVMIPTFSAIIKKANISSDIQTARNMGVILTAEKPQNAYEAVAALKKHGFERLHPKTKFYSFYWIKSLNTVILTDEGDHPIYPEEMICKHYDPGDWFDLTDAYNAPETTEEEAIPSEPPISTEPPAEPIRCLVTYEVDNKDYLDLSQCVFTDTVTQGEDFLFKVAPKDGYMITEVHVAMINGDNVRKFTLRDPITDPMEFDCGKATGDIEVSITVEERAPTFVNVTFTCNKPEYLIEMPQNTTVAYGETYSFQLAPAAGGQYWITKVTIYQGGKQLKVDHLSAGESYSSRSIKATDDLEINVHVVKYCIVKFAGDGIKQGSGMQELQVEWGVGALFEEGDLQKYFVPSGYEILSVTAQMGDRTLDVYDPVTKELHLKSIVENTTVTFVFKKKQ